MSDLVRSLRLFRDLGGTGNFSALARQKNLSHTTIARSIDELEAHFGVRLFHRTTRGLKLTGDGERLMDHTALILDQLERAEAELAGTAVIRGLVRMGVTTALGLHYAERLSILRDAHPGLSVEILVADWRDVTADSGLDLWLTVRAPDTGTAEALGSLPRILVAAPAYLQKHGTPETVDDLSGHECLSYGYEARPSAWMIDGRELPLTGFLRANSSEAVQRATRGGLGIALLPRIQVEDELARGLVVQLLPEAGIPPIAVAVAHYAWGQRMPLRVRAAMNFLVEHFPGNAAPADT